MQTSLTIFFFFVFQPPFVVYNYMDNLPTFSDLTQISPSIELGCCRNISLTNYIELGWCRNISLTNYIELGCCRNIFLTKCIKLGCCRNISLATMLLLVTRIWIRTWMMELHSHVHQVYTKCSPMWWNCTNCTRMQPNAIIITIDIISPHYLLQWWATSTAGCASSHILTKSI